jgi:hypothetical protein
MSLYHYQPERAEHPVDVVERLAATNEWSFDREDRDEISISVRGGWTDYHVAFTWLSDMEALHVACAFDLKVTDHRRTEVLGLVSLINEQLWIGHFDLWPKDNVVMFRHSLLLVGGAEPNASQCETVLQIAVNACERYYQAFQFVVWAARGAREALDSAMFETCGKA